MPLSRHLSAAFGPPVRGLLHLIWATSLMCQKNSCRFADSRQEFFVSALSVRRGVHRRAMDATAYRRWAGEGRGAEGRAGGGPCLPGQCSTPSATPGADDAACGQLGGQRSGRPAGRTVAARRRSARRWRWRWPSPLVLVACCCAYPLGRLLRITTRYARACHAHNQALCGDSGTIAAP